MRAAGTLAARPDAAPAAEPERPRKPALEIELKLAVPASAREAIRRQLSTYGAQPPVMLESVYFDTADRRLAAREAALRVRRVGDGPDAYWVQTLKTVEMPGALTRRGEF